MSNRKHIFDKNQLKLYFDYAISEKNDNDKSSLENTTTMQVENDDLSRKYNIHLDDSKEVDWDKDYLAARGHKFSLEINEIKTNKVQAINENVSSSIRKKTNPENEFDCLDFIENKLKEFAGVDNLDDMCYLRDSIIKAPYKRKKSNIHDIIYYPLSINYFLSLFRYLEKSERSLVFDYLNDLIIEYNDEDDSSDESDY